MSLMCLSEANCCVTVKNCSNGYTMSHKHQSTWIWCSYDAFQTNVNPTTLTSACCIRVLLTLCSVCKWGEREVLSARLLLTDWLLALVLCPAPPARLSEASQYTRELSPGTGGMSVESPVYWPDWRHPLSATLSSLWHVSHSPGSGCVIIESLTQQKCSIESCENGRKSRTQSTRIELLAEDISLAVYIIKEWEVVPCPSLIHYPTIILGDSLTLDGLLCNTLSWPSKEKKLNVENNF